MFWTLYALVSPQNLQDDAVEDYGVEVDFDEMDAEDQEVSVSSSPVREVND